MEKVVINGSGGIKFVKYVYTYSLRHPQYGFKRVEQTIEYRRDPIAGYWSRLNRERAKRPEQQANFDEEEFEYFALSLSKKCPFCTPRIYNNTPMFISEYVDAGRLERETTIMFPNAYPFAAHHAVAVFRRDHYIRIDEIRAGDVKAALFAYKEYFSRIKEVDPAAKYASINMNFLPPAGASIIHPHMQVFVDYVPTWMIRKLLVSCKKYYKQYKSNPWTDLIESEIKLKERFIVGGNVLTWVAAFAPLGNSEVIGIGGAIPSDFLKLSDDDLEGMAEDISNMLGAFYSVGYRSVNMAIFMSPLGKDLKYFKINVRIVGRKNPAHFYTNDRAFMEILHKEVVATKSPEDVAQNLRLFY